MKKTAIKCISAAASAVMLMSAFSSECLAAESGGYFDSTEYCRMTAKYTKGSGTRLSWKKFEGAKKYMVYRSVNGDDFKLLTSTDKLSYTDKKVQSGNTYSYKVYASDGTNKSEVSDYFFVDIGDDGSAETYYYDVPTDYGQPDQRDYPYPDPYLYDYALSADGSVYEESESVGAADEYAEEDYCEEDYVYEEEESAVSDDGNEYYYYSNEQISAGTLTAGRWNDNESYSDFLKTLKTDWGNYSGTWKISPAGRYTVNVTDGEAPIENAKAEVLDSKGNVIMSAVTNNKGTAYVFPGIIGKGAASIKVSSSDGSQVVTTSFKKIRSSTLDVEFKPCEKAAKQLDLMFLVDTTGSMGDELEYLKKETEDVINRVSEANNGIDIRTCVNFYRDEGDEYTVRSFMFRDRIATVQHSLSQQYASGGGDYPEAVHEALDVAVNKQKWNEDSTKIMFWLLDAPPHDDADVIKAYRDRILDAAAKGIRIVPVISSGTDTETEYLTRSAAVLTGGTFLFLTDDSGVGYEHHEPSVGQHEVKKLNDLMVNIINEYLE